MNEHYRQKLEELCQELGTCPEGLSSETAAKHLEQYGKNAIAEAKKKPTWLIFLEQFKDFLVIILIIAALISAFTGDLESFIVIIAVITMNAILGTVQTVKAEKSLSNLKKLSSPTAKVLRDGQTAILPAEEITVGDVVLLEAGDQIPADGRLIDCASLQTNESALTGESTNVEKSLDTITDEVPLADRKNMVYSGGFVTYGRGAYVVTEVGMQTEVGKIASLIQNAEARKTPLQITLDQFGKRLSIGIMIVCALVFVLSSRVQNMSVGGARATFFAYALLNGMVLSYYFLIFDLGTLVLAFLATSLYFGLMAVYGTTTHKDLSGWGPKLMMGLFALIITGFVGMLFGMSFLTTVLYSAVGLVVFMLLTAYDTQKLSQMYSYYAGDSELAEKASIYGALTLYLDFINIFLYVVRLLGMNSRSRNN